MNMYVNADEEKAVHSNKQTHAPETSICREEETCPKEKTEVEC